MRRVVLAGCLFWTAMAQAHLAVWSSHSTHKIRPDAHAA